jgi:type VI secretion system protein ImpM
MRCGLYGKLPAKRDFIAFNVPQRVLEVLEPWLQQGLAISRSRFGAAWQQMYLRAPIWRFWLGAGVCGNASVLGAVMPSVDKIGRCFPLTVLAMSEREDPIPPPEVEPQEKWFFHAEELLLSALDTEVTFEAVCERLSRLQTAMHRAPTNLTKGLVRFPDGTVLTSFAPETFKERILAVRIENSVAVDETATVWWTIGGEGFEPLALLNQQMPNPSVFSTLLTGRTDTKCSDDQH